MAEFRDQDLSGSTFQHVRLKGSTIEDADLSEMTVRNAWMADADFRGVMFPDVRMRGVGFRDAEIDGEIEGRFVVNGVDLAPLIEAERARQDPDYALLHPTDPDGFRAAWAMLERRWAALVERARALPPERLHESVGGEWSFIQTLRHLAFATECWLLRAIQGDPRPWQPLSLPWDEAPPTEGVPHDREARPDLDTALALRLDRAAKVRAYLETLTDDELGAMTTPVTEPGWPEPESFPVRECLLTILREEWEHRRYAERDLAGL
ncbi:DinB family protein [Nocardioides sp.]|uniref:DinB family protein n=1 Tax=Nocardioides sp. TaxID=35761 RepID=UPI0035273D9C